MTTLYVTHGITGSGKTTFAKRFCRQTRIFRISHDELMMTLYGTKHCYELFPCYYENVNRVIRKIITELVSQHIDVFLDVCLFTRLERDSWREFAKAHEIDFCLFHIKCPEDVALKRVLERNKNKEEFVIDRNNFNLINSRVEPLGSSEPCVVIETCHEE